MRKVQVAEDKPCNRILTNYCRNIVENYNGYLTGQDITYTSISDFSDIQAILNYNDVQSEDSEFLRNALIFGIAFEINYIDEDGQQRFKVLDSRECIPIYENSLTQDLIAVIRFYQMDGLDLTKGYYVDLYTDNSIEHYKANFGFTTLSLIDVEPHYYGMVPITVFKLNNEAESIFKPIMSLQDAYNKLVSAEVDDFEAFADAYMVIKGVHVDAEMAAEFRQKRIIDVTGDGMGEVDVSYLTKNISDTQIQNMLQNLNDTIHKIANSPDFSQESFGTSSGIALRYRLLGFENQAGSIEKNMTKALQRRIELISAILNLKGSDTIWRDISIQFTRNLPIDIADIISTVNGLRGLVSDKTLLSQIPFVQDVDAEMEAIQEQKEANIANYGFTTEVVEE